MKRIIFSFKILIYLCAVFIITTLQPLKTTSYARDDIPHSIVLKNAYVFDGLGSYYETISSDTEQYLYDKIVEGLESAVAGHTPFIETGIDLVEGEDRLIEIAHMVLYDHPKYSAFWNTCRMELRNRSQFRIVAVDDTSLMIDDAVYNSLVLSLKGDTDFNTAWNIYRYMAATFSYDFDIGDHASDDYGVFHEQKACCQGISFAYKRFMDAAGIPCTVLTSYTAEGQYHMLNAVYLSGHWYLCDVTNALGSTTSSGFCMNAWNASSVLHDIVYAPK